MGTVIPTTLHGNIRQHLIEHIADTHFAFIGKPKVPKTEFGSTLDLAITSVDLIRNLLWPK